MSPHAVAKPRQRSGDLPAVGQFNAPGRPEHGQRVARQPAADLARDIVTVELTGGDGDVPDHQLATRPGPRCVIQQDGGIFTWTPSSPRSDQDTR